MSRQARLGLIVLAGVLAFVVALFVLANRTFLLSDTYRVKAQFNDVGGLLPGGPVQYQGIGVGRVEYVQLPDVPGGPITVGMAIREDARDLVRQDSRAVIQTEGLVGNMMVTLQGGSATEPIVAEGGTITGVDPFNFAQVTDRLFESVSRFDSVTVSLTGMMGDIRAGQGTLGQFLYDERLYEETVLTTQETRATLQRLGNQTDAIVGLVADASADLTQIIEKVNTGEGTLAQLINNDAIHTELLQAASAFSASAEDVETVTDRAEDAANWATLAMFRLAENMEALKENWFFKGYYERRGYREMAPFEIREQALEETYQTLEERERELYEWERRLAERSNELGVEVETEVPPAPAPPPEVDAEPEAEADAGAADAPGGLD
ncbi:MAG: MlaD family protein [Rhodothermales bacterium]|nr:MlaD family protein [Rhodothermales bacterium]